MSDNWDDDDYDSNAQFAAEQADKIAALGLDEVFKQEQKPVAQGSQQTEINNESKKTDNLRPVMKVNQTMDRELTEQEKREAQMRTDAAHALDLFGLTAERKEPTFDDLQTKADFEAYAEKLGAQFTARHEHPHYLYFVNCLVEHLTKQMSKIQLQTIRDTVQVPLDVILNREEEQQKRKQDQQKQKETQKKKVKQVKEDLLEDDYDDYDEKFHRY